ncbi:hypothetical protein RsY01_1668 [Lactococcus reticulitermitis]|uniref:Sigma factor regulator C-terminal domain-containing protein n=2 Tax=Pseudolactococcus reticulitermitis TaxID=2025039 RepID=A0A224XD51_9LACT|nr:hypothetical protein RsY01_1668 [Lactococcus reticulitermitis]
MQLDENFDKLIKKEKWKKIVKTIAISFVTTLVLLFIGYTVSNRGMALQYEKAKEMANIIDMIESPNLISRSQYLSKTGWVTSQLKSERFKNIDGYLVAAVPLEINFSLFDVGYARDQNSPLTIPITKTKDIGAFSRENGEKLPMFFNPKHKQKSTEQEAKPTHEARTLSGLKNHVAEVAISFKEPMTYAEIQAKLPDHLLINWYWLGMASDQLSVTDTIGKVIGLNADEAGKLEDESLETPSSSSWSSANYPSFVAAVKTAAEKRGYNVAGIDLYQDALKQVEKYPTLKTAKFAGLIVSGRTENLAKLDDLPFVYATNVGLQTEILPYIQPTK